MVSPSENHKNCCRLTSTSDWGLLGHSKHAGTILAVASALSYLCHRFSITQSAPVVLHPNRYARRLGYQLWLPVGNFARPAEGTHVQHCLDPSARIHVRRISCRCRVLFASNESRCKLPEHLAALESSDSHFLDLASVSLAVHAASSTP